MKIGLDIGIASVGWAVVDDDYKVLEAGSNLFESADASKNVERRSFRQLKRLHRRQQNRISDFNKLWKKQGLEIPQEVCNTQLSLRVKGLTEKLANDEFYYVLVNMLKHRGISYLDDAIEDEGKSSSKYEMGIKANKEQLEEGKFPCQIQMARLEKYGKYRGEIIDGDMIMSNVYTVSSYEKEIEAIFEKQKQENNCITDNFEKEYISIFNRKRKYYEGPGNELSRTDYGIYTTKIDENTGRYKTELNLFDKLIGKCTIYPDLRRAAGASYTAQEFNLLNDLNNLIINNRKLEEEEKHKIVQTILVSNTVNMRKIIEKVIGEKIEVMSGARIDKDEKEIFHKFEQYNKMRKELNEISVDITSFERDELDKIGEILTLNTDKEAILLAFENEGLNYSEEIKECFVQIRKKNGSLFSKWQSFSLRIMNELIPEMYIQPKNQMELLTDMGVFKTSADVYKNYKYIPKDIITQEIYNPVVGRSIRITIDILNALIKKYGYPEKIVIEMPRDRNSEEEKQRISSEQSKNEKELAKIIKSIHDEYGIEITKKDFYRHKQLGLKLKLWDEQGRKCPYSGKPIAIEDILNDPYKFEIDHIIPRSISFDDSRSNKVLVYGVENQEKGNRTPYMYLTNVKREWDWHSYMSYILELKANKLIDKSKVDKLLFTEDITKISVLKGFIARNLNDTRYASRVVLNTVQSFMKAKEADTKVKVIRGSFTHQMRKAMRLDKNRDESFVHHAVDAMLICYSQMGYDTFYKLQQGFIDFEDEKVTDKSSWDECMNEEVFERYMYTDKWSKIRENISDAEKRVKYWHKVDKKANRGLCNQTIRGTREYNGKIEKINKINIYSRDGYKTFVNMINKGKEEQFLMYKNDRRTFEDILKIYNQYKDAVNAFTEYEKETGDYVRKYAKNHKGCRIENLKYRDGEVGACIDISNKYGCKEGSKKVILESLNPYRMDVYYNINDKKYYFVGLKMSDLKFSDGKYMLDMNKYNNVLVKEKMIKEGENREDLLRKGYEFRLSFYKNEYIKYDKDGELYIERFLSRTMPKARNYIETKPIDASKFPGKPQNQIGLSKTEYVSKVRVDILGNQYECKREKFELYIDNTF